MRTHTTYTNFVKSESDRCCVGRRGRTGLSKLGVPGTVGELCECEVSYFAYSNGRRENCEWEKQERQ